MGSTPSEVSEGPLGRVWPSLPHLVSSCLEVCWQLHRGFSECPLGRVWPSLPHLISTVWKSAGNCIGGFPRAPSVGCGLPYHIWSLLSRILLATALGVSEVPLARLWPSLPHLVSTVWKSAGNCIGGFSECPLGRVWPSLPHLVSNSLGVCWQLHRGFPRSPSVGCGLPYHISSLTLWESAGNCSGTQTQLS